MHIPVLLHELIDDAALLPGMTVVDGTLGGGGHAREELRLIEHGIFVGIDQDVSSLARNSVLVSEYPDATIHLVHSNFRAIKQVCGDIGITSVDRIIADLGFSSFQIDDPERGFSFRYADAPLDMRMDTTTGLTAADILNTWDEDVIADMLYAYGDESRSRTIAKAIVDHRKHSPFKTVKDVSEIVTAILDPKGHGRKKTGTHPETKTFQALRIAVNDEYGALKEFLHNSFDLLAPSGRLVILTFHSGEDRIVKQTFASYVDSGVGTLLHKKPIAPRREETISNPRARSAHLRTIIKN